MLRRCLSVVVLAGGMLILPACESVPSGVAAQSQYQAPARGAEVGFLQGSRRRLGFLADDHYGYVLLIDRKFVPGAKKSWDKPIPLAVGRRMITAEYNYGPYTARAEIMLEVKPGTTYRLRIMNGTEGPEGARFNDFWIVDGAGKVVSQVYHSSVSGGSTYNPFSVN